MWFSNWSDWRGACARLDGLGDGMIGEARKVWWRCIDVCSRIPIHVNGNDGGKRECNALA